MSGASTRDPLRFEASPIGGSWAMQADGSCLCSSGSTHVLATIVCDTSQVKRTEDGGLPLQCDYSEGAYARGKVPDSISKRERQGDREVLIARAIDRAIRPLFRPGFSYETHICAQALSRGGSEVDDQDCVEAMAINAASAAIMSCHKTCKQFAGPIGAVLVIKSSDGRFVVSSGGGSSEGSAGRGPLWLNNLNPSSESLAVSAPDHKSSFKMLYAGTIDKAVMVEMEADQVTPAELAEAMSLAQAHVADLVKCQSSVASAARRVDRNRFVEWNKRTDEELSNEDPLREEKQLRKTYVRPTPLTGASYDLVEQIEKEGRELIMAALQQEEERDQSKAGRARAVAKVKRTISSLPSLASTKDAYTAVPGSISSAFDSAFDIVLSQCMRELCIVRGKRVDGRALDEIRPLTCELSPFPPSFPNKLHGSALFGRGETQSLCIATVGNLLNTDPINILSSYLTEEQRVRQRENLVVHYEFPPWATNETGMISGRANRREVGHGALALKALRPLMPDSSDFSFLTRIVAKTTSSNGSSSMAAVCGGSLALKMAGVPIESLVAGISVGLLSERWAAPLTSLSGDDNIEEEEEEEVEEEEEDKGGEGEALDHKATDDRSWPERMGLHLTDGRCNYGQQALLLDIQGMEDGMGDMDLKVAGTSKGLTAIQLDIKLPGIPIKLLMEAIQMGCKGLEKLLNSMEVTLIMREYRLKDLPAIGPQHKVHRLTPDLIIPLVGEKGESIASLQERSGAVISAKIDGEVQVYAPNPSAMEAAMLGIRAIQGTDLEEGQSYFAKVHEILDYGAVLEMTSGARHLLPVGEISQEKLRGDIRDILTEGQVLKVKCLGRDNRGLLVLSCWRQCLPSSLSGAWTGPPSSSSSSSPSSSSSSSSSASSPIQASTTAVSSDTTSAAAKKLRVVPARTAKPEAPKKVKKASNPIADKEPAAA